MLRPAAFLCVFLALSAPSAYATDDYECLITSKTAPASAPQFSAYPAKPWHGNTTKIKLVTPIAREFRTELREYQKKGYGTDFAGRFKIYSLGGCGTSCTIWAAVDDQTGIARDAGKFNMVIGAHVMDDEWIEVRADSRLVILKGYSEGLDSAFISVGKALDAQLGTPNNPGTTRYSFFPDTLNWIGGLFNAFFANSNSANNTLVQCSAPSGQTYTYPTGTNPVGNNDPATKDNKDTNQDNGGTNNGGRPDETDANQNSNNRNANCPAT